jgi:hypothetical protein
MREPTPRELASARREAAIHEAGHVVVGRHIGRRLRCPDPVAKIFRNEGGHPSERTWWGMTNFYNIERLNPLESRTIAFAGAAAWCTWRGIYLDPDLWTDPNLMSPTDWIMAGCKPGEPDRLCLVAVSRLRRMVSKNGRLWGDLLRHARQLIVDARPVGSKLGPRSHCVRPITALSD